MMRKVLFLFALTALIGCSSMAKPTGNKSFAICPNDSVNIALSDSVSRVVFQAENIELYSIVESGDTVRTTNDFVFKSMQRIVMEDTDSTTFAIDSLVHDTLRCVNVETMNNAYTSILLFLLSDDGMYMKGQNYPLSPFVPEYLVQFNGKEHSVQLVISLSGGLFRFYYDFTYIKTLKYMHESFMLRFLYLVTDEESLKELLKLNIN